jgi:hypothetical protein
MATSALARQHCRKNLPVIVGWIELGTSASRPRVPLIRNIAVFIVQVFPGDQQLPVVTIALKDRCAYPLAGRSIAGNRRHGANPFLRRAAAPVPLLKDRSGARPKASLKNYSTAPFRQRQTGSFWTDRRGYRYDGFAVAIAQPRPRRDDPSQIGVEKCKPSTKLFESESFSSVFRRCEIDF